MMRPTALHDICGTISDILAPNRAVIFFFFQEQVENALLTSAEFYHGGKRIPRSQRLDKYLARGTAVKFSCEYSNEIPKNPNWNWHATMCWIAEIPRDRISIDRCLRNVSGKITELEGRHGIFSLLNGTEICHRIMFLASKVYVNGKRFPSGKILSDVLFVDEEVTADAVPCIPEENEANCSWFATCVFKGQRRKLIHDNHRGIGKHNLTSEFSVNRNENENKFRIQFLDLVDQHIYERKSACVRGRGMILGVIDEEFGVIIGEFEQNIFQTILFHRGNFFLFKTCLRQYDLLEFISKKDRVKFIAVAAPLNFPTDWIAIQVSIDENRHR